MNATPRETDPGKRRGGRPRRALDAEEIRRLKAEGRSLREIARKLHAGYGTVYRLAGEPKRDPAAIQNPVAPALQAIADHALTHKCES